MITPLQARLLTLLCSIAILVLATFGDRGKASRGLDMPSSVSEAWSLRRMLLVSFLTLFAELAVIRWIAVEVRVFCVLQKSSFAALLCRVWLRMRLGG